MVCTAPNPPDPEKLNHLFYIARKYYFKYLLYDYLVHKMLFIGELKPALRLNSPSRR